MGENALNPRQMIWHSMTDVTKLAEAANLGFAVEIDVIAVHNPSLPNGLALYVGRPAEWCRAGIDTDTLDGIVMEPMDEIIDKLSAERIPEPTLLQDYLRLATELGVKVYIEIKGAPIMDGAELILRELLRLHVSDDYRGLLDGHVLMTLHPEIGRKLLKNFFLHKGVRIAIGSRQHFGSHSYHSNALSSFREFETDRLIFLFQDRCYDTQELVVGDRYDVPIGVFVLDRTSDVLRNMQLIGPDMLVVTNNPQMLLDSLSNT